MSKKFYIVIIAVLAVLLAAAISIVFIVSSSEELQTEDEISTTTETSLFDKESTSSDKSESINQDSEFGVPDPTFKASGDLLEDLTGLIFTEDSSGNLVAQAVVLSIDAEANEITLSLQTGVDASEMTVTGKASYGNLSAEKQAKIERTIEVGSSVKVTCQFDADSSSLVLIDLTLEDR